MLSGKGYITAVPDFGILLRRKGKNTESENFAIFAFFAVPITEVD
jgi:hypothetical protein